MDRWQMDGWQDGWIDGIDGWMNRWISTWMDGYMDRKIAGFIDGRYIRDYIEWIVSYHNNFQSLLFRSLTYYLISLINYS